MSSKTRRIVLGIIAVLLIGGVIAWWLSGFSLDFMRFFAAEPGTDQGTVTPTSSAVAQPVVSCAPGTQTITVGQPATVSASGGSGPYTWYAPGGTIDGSGDQIAVTYTTVGTKKVTVQAARSGSAEIDSVACTVVVGQ